MSVQHFPRHTHVAKTRTPKTEMKNKKPKKRKKRIQQINPTNKKKTHTDTQIEIQNQTSKNFLFFSFFFLVRFVETFLNFENSPKLTKKKSNKQTQNNHCPLFCLFFSFQFLFFFLLFCFFVLCCFYFARAQKQD